MANNLTPIDSFKAVLNEQTIRAQVQNSLRDKGKAGAFLSSMIDLYNGDTTLQQCNPRAVALECIKAASLDLPINKNLGFAYVVPYKNKPTFTIGYKGLIQLAMRSGQYRYINAGTVREGELKGMNKLSGMLDLSGEAISDTIIGYFAYFQLINGAEKTLYMSKKEAEDWRDRYSPSAKSSYSPWKTDFDKMAMKTCLRRLLGTYGIMSTEMQQAIAGEAEAEMAANANKIQVQIPAEPEHTTLINADTGEVLEDELP